MTKEELKQLIEETFSIAIEPPYCENIFYLKKWIEGYEACQNQIVDSLFNTMLKNINDENQEITDVEYKHIDDEYQEIEDEFICKRCGALWMIPKEDLKYCPKCGRVVKWE